MRVLCVDDHAIFRQGVKQILLHFDRGMNIGEASTADEAMKLVREGRWDVVVLDPPYAERTLDSPLDQLRAHLAPGALVVVKHFWRTPIPTGSGLEVSRTRRFGETALTFLEEER